MQSEKKVKAKLIRPIIPIEEWLEDEFYLGPECYALRPYVKKTIIEFYKGKKHEFIFTGASRTGKSYCARILILRYLYEMSCYDNFPCLFGLSPSTLPKIIWFAFSKGKSDSTGIGALIRMIDKIPYFQQPDIKRRDVDSIIDFPFCQIFPGSQVQHAIGEDMIGAILDEANVRRVAKGSEVQEAQQMFTEIQQRSVMTFSINGHWGGFSGIISSATTTSSFTAVQVEKNRNNPDCQIMECAVYEANPEQYSKETFKVFIGNQTIKPFIVDQITADNVALINSAYGMSEETFYINYPELVIDVPCSIRKFYEDNLGYAIMNMSGKVQSGGAVWINNNKYIKQMWNEDRKPLPIELPQIGIFDHVVWTDWLDEEYTMMGYHGENVYIHVDPSQKHDHTGFSALYWDVEAHKIKSLLTTEFTIDKGKPDNQIDQTKIWALIMLLRDWGAQIKLVTGDHYAKDFIIPQAKMQKEICGMTGEYYSADTDEMVAYLTMYNYMKMNMFSIPYYKQLEYELENLQRDLGTGKIDHPHNSNPNEPVYFKDCSDAFAVASFHIYTRENVSYDEEIINKRVDKMESDGFYDDLLTYSEPEDDITNFEESLLGMNVHELI